MSLSSLPTLLIVPPLNLLAAACVGAAFHRRRVGRVLLGVALSGLTLLAMPLVSGSLLASLESGLPTVPTDTNPPAAIVILSGDVVDTEDAHPEYDVGHLTLERERAGARLARATGLPILVSGGHFDPKAPSIAALMQISLHQDFGLSPLWLEERSQDTWENAADSAVIMRANQIDTVYVVTHAWHMRRALIAFRAAGLNAVAAPVDPERSSSWSLSMLVPHVSAWQQSYYAFHEWIGCAWYALHG